MKVQKKTQLIMPGFPIFYEKNVLLLKKKKKFTRAMRLHRKQ